MKSKLEANWNLNYEHNFTVQAITMRWRVEKFVFRIYKWIQMLQKCNKKPSKWKKIIRSVVLLLMTCSLNDWMWNNWDSILVLSMCCLCVFLVDIFVAIKSLLKRVKCYEWKWCGCLAEQLFGVLIRSHFGLWCTIDKVKERKTKWKSLGNRKNSDGFGYSVEPSSAMNIFKWIGGDLVRTHPTYHFHLIGKYSLCTCSQPVKIITMF